MRPEPKITPELVREHGLSPEEYQKVLEILGREPNYTELGVFSVMWSEHCSYKSSRAHLKGFPTSGPRVIQGPGENAGVVDIGGGLAVVFKMESHNHPSFIEPYQGAATGVGGILRDVFTMGARPVANMNSLRFGAPDHPRTKYLFGGVVAGIGGYGNCMGIPTVAGEVFFNPSYNGNILVNAFTLGVAPADKIFYGKAAGVGNPVIYVGSKTGRDGIHGATMASAEFDDASEEKRPTVQVGDPFTEKLLLEACLELFKTDYVVGIQDMGAAGLTSSSFEMAGRAGTGVVLDLDKVPQREEGMTPYEMMLSESQERMLLVARTGTEAKVLEIFEKWDLDCAVVGRVTDDGLVRVLFQGKEVACIPAAPLSNEAPVYHRPMAPPAGLAERRALDLDAVAIPADMTETLLAMVGSPNLCSRRKVWRQYDHTVRTDTVVLPGSDAAVVRVKGTTKAVAMSCDCNSRYVWLDPFLGAQHAVAEAARNVSMTGAEPIGLTDCLNFGNPEKPEIMWQFAEACRGLAEACRALDIPVVSGNVSLYNETDGSPVHPTPSIGMVGLLEDVSRATRGFFERAGDAVVLVGDAAGTLGGSEYLHFIHALERGAPPALDLAAERAMQAFVREAVGRGLLRSAHDVSDGGLAVALAECCMGERPLGARVDVTAPGRRLDELLFGEGAARAVLSCEAAKLEALLALARERGVPAAKIGDVGGARLRIGGAVDADLGELKDRWERGLEAL